MARVLLTSAALIVSSLATVARADYEYTLPGDALWPSAADWEVARRDQSADASIFVRGEPGYDLTGLYEHPVFNERSGLPQPAAIARPKTAEDVRGLVLFARRHMLRVAVFNTGYNSDARSTADNALVIHLAEMDSVEPDIPAQTVTCGGGAKMGELATSVTTASGGTLVALMGPIGTLGVWGWAVGGGIGPLTRLYGLGVDAMVSVTVVTAEGDIVTATDDNEHSGLLWAVRGGGGPAFGIGVSITFRLFPNPGPMRSFMGMYPQTDYVAREYAAAVQNSTLGGIAYYMVDIVGVVRILAFCFGPECDGFMSDIVSIESCLGYRPLYCREITNLPFPMGFLSTFGTTVVNGRSEWVTGGAATGEIESSVLAVNTWTKAVKESLYYKRRCWIQSCMGGAASTTDLQGNLTSVALGMRQSQQKVSCLVEWGSDVSSDGALAAIAVVHRFEREALAPLSPARWVYWNEAPHAFETEDEWTVRYWGSHDRYADLLDVKLAYDPSNFLTCHHCVGWNFSAAVDPAVCPSNNCSCSNNPTGACSLLP